MERSHGYVALGSNLGDRRKNLERAVEAMRERGLAPDLRSSIWETEPVGDVEQGWFLNMVVRIRPSEPARRVLEILLDIERRAGRIRDGDRDGPRVLDLDLLTLGEAQIAEPGLSVPHPRMWERRFVLAPLAELDPLLRNPATGKTVERTLDELEDPSEVRRLGVVAAPTAGPV